MRKLTLGLSSAAILLTPTLALASVTPSPVQIQIKPPAAGINPYTPVGTILSNALTIIFVVAALLVLFMLIIGAFNWIMSGGDKEKVGAARQRITQALVGLAVLALAFLITVVVGQVLNINILDFKTLPTLGQRCGEGQVYDPAGTPPGCVQAPGR